MNSRMLILHLLAQRAGKGATSTEIAQAAGITRRSAYQTIWRMAADLQVFQAGPRNLMRFYALKSWADEADKVLRAEMARIAQEGKERRNRMRNERLRKQSEARAKERKEAKRKADLERDRKERLAQAQRRAAAASPWRADASKRKGKAPDAPIVIPENVKITIAPTPVDYRFHVDPSHKGEFSRGKLGDTLGS